ncbi:MAG TPA: hypothetical protein VHR66_16160 [Gemmataceae bacterium]|jgi:hypothetical protein|nr:hypothetical protein [Gemmataceae bacterium]
MIRRHWPILALALALIGVGLNLQAQPAPATPKGPPPVAVPDVGIKELVARQQNLERQYKAFTTNLLALKQKLEKSDRIEDKDKAKALQKAIDLADKEGVDNKFTKLLSTLTSKTGGLDLSISDITSASNQNDDLIKALREILAILQSDDELDRIKAEQKLLERMLAELNSLIRATNINQARTDSGKGDPKQLAKDQDKLANKVNDLATKLGSPKAGGNPKEGEPKGGAKSEPKEGDPQGEHKDDTKDPKADEKPNGDKADPMKSDGAESKASKGGPPSDGAKASKGGPPKDGGDSKPAGDKKDQTAEKRNKEDNKGDQKGSAAKTPPGPKSDAQASNKSQGNPSGSPSGQPKPAGSPSGNPPPPPPPGNKLPGADQVRKAVPDEENAAGNLDQDKRPKASEDLTKADDALRQAREELEKRLKQLREQELERLLANLEARVNKMLAWQIEVKSATEAINVQISKHPEKKAQPVDFQNAQKQEDKEAEIINEADKAIQLLQNEGSAVAFPGVFEEVRKDMIRVKERLHDANVGDDTQAIEQDIIEALTHMRDALKKAQQELGKSPPPPPGGPPPDQPQLQKLLDEIAELKMIRTLQVQVNDRTKRYGNKVPGAEQADDPQIKKELKDLGDRQEKIETMINNMDKKKNQ